MEKLLGERQREYAESIAYHFQNSDTPERAVPYLLIAGKKAIERYALAEAEAHYRSAYDILLSQPESTERDHLLLELLVDWSLLHYYTAEVDVMNRLMKEHADLLERVPDRELCGMWLTWHCFVAYTMVKAPESIAFADRAIVLGEEVHSARVLAYAYTQKAWASWNMFKSTDVVTFAEKALSFVDQLTDERDATYVRLKATCAASFGWLAVGDLIKARALAGELMDFAISSGSARALCFAHLASANIAFNAGDTTRAIAEAGRSRAAAADPFYKSTAEAFLPGWLISAGDVGAARGILEPFARFAEKHELVGFTIVYQVCDAMILLSEGQPARGMDQLLSVKRKADDLGYLMGTIAALNEAFVYARIATGESKGSIGVMFRNPGFVLGKARKASDIAREMLAKFSDELSPDMEVFRFAIEFEFAKLLIKRKERDEARKHIEKAIAFLQPLGDSVGMRDARALLATLDAK